MKSLTPCALAIALVSSAAVADELLVFAAASVGDALQETAALYQKETGEAVLLSTGASSDLARQVRAGAPADVFLSADLAQMEALEKAGQVAAGARRELLSNQLVVVV